MSRVRVVYDRNMKVMAWLPPSASRIDIGREAYAGVPVPMSPRRIRGDATKIEALFRNFTEDQKKDLLRLLRGLSRKHAVLTLSGEETRLADAGSRNGVTLKGVGIGGADKKLSEGEDFLLKNGTVFELGAWPLQFFDDPDQIEKLRQEKPGIYAVTTT
jgi:hypothetical protein